MKGIATSSGLVALAALCLAQVVSASELFNPNAPSGNAIVRINAGGPNYKDEMGQQWVSDRFFTAGGTRGQLISKTRLSGDDKVLKTSRWALHFLGSSNVGYEIPVMPNREYSVELLIPANSPSLVDQVLRRKQEVDIWVQGKRPFNNLKVVASGPGGVMRVQTKKGYYVDKTGMLKIRVVSFNAAPAIAGLVVYDVTPPPTGSPTTPPTKAPTVFPTEAPIVTPTEAPVVTPTEAPVVSPTEAPVVSPTEAPVATPTEAPIASTMPPSFDLLMRLNSGSFAYVDPVTGTSWSDDDYVDVVGNYTLEDTTTILGTDDQGVYRSERVDSIGFSYTIPVPSGEVKVVLHFAEIYWSIEDARVFNVSIEDFVVLSNLDIYKAVGRNTAMVSEFTVQVDDGILDIDFMSKKDGPKVSGIEVYVPR